MAANPLKFAKLGSMLGSAARLPKAEPSFANEFRPERVLKKKEVKEIDKPIKIKPAKSGTIF